jgi:nucleotide-binding universal stress UspA family protein
MKILVPVDGSSYSANAVDFVAHRGSLMGSEPSIELLNVQLPVPARAARVVGKSVVEGYYADEAKKALKPAQQRLAKAGVTCIARHVVGNPAEQIAKAAEDDDADLIVMGSHGRSALRGLIFGSITHGVLAHTLKPLLILRAKVSRSTAASTGGLRRAT